jgi:hypothetical protein
MGTLMGRVFRFPRESASGDEQAMLAMECDIMLTRDLGRSSVPHPVQCLAALVARRPYDCWCRMIAIYLSFWPICLCPIELVNTDGDLDVVSLQAKSALDWQS